jgi:hypothetical protein
MPPLTAITFDWRPGEATYHHLAQLSIPRSFIEDQVAEFVLYWQERGQQNHSWNAKFAKHVLHEWRLHEVNQAKQQAVKPLTAMTSDWKPSNKATDFLLKAGMSTAFIEECTASFVLYWQETGALHNTWNSKFVGHCQYHWNQQNKAAAIALYRATNANDATRGSSLTNQLTDRSWANK